MPSAGGDLGTRVVSVVCLSLSRLELESSGRGCVLCPVSPGVPGSGSDLSIRTALFRLSFVHRSGRKSSNSCDIVGSSLVSRFISIGISISGAVVLESLSRMSFFSILVDTLYLGVFAQSGEIGCVGRSDSYSE